MNQVLNANDFVELDEREAMDVDGGGVVAAVYALGFVFGCSPLGAIGICTAIGVASVVGGVAVTKYLS